jgi:hypothetical protein
LALEMSMRYDKPLMDRAFGGHGVNVVPPFLKDSEGKIRIRKVQA